MCSWSSWSRRCLSSCCRHGRRPGRRACRVGVLPEVPAAGGRVHGGRPAERQRCLCRSRPRESGLLLRRSLPCPGREDPSPAQGALEGGYGVRLLRPGVNPALSHGLKHPVCGLEVLLPQGRPQQYGPELAQRRPWGHLRRRLLVNPPLLGDVAVRAEERLPVGDPGREALCPHIRKDLLGRCCVATTSYDQRVPMVPLEVTSRPQLIQQCPRLRALARARACRHCCEVGGCPTCGFIQLRLTLQLVERRDRGLPAACLLVRLYDGNIGHAALLHVVRLHLLQHLLDLGVEPQPGQESEHHVVRHDVALGQLLPEDLLGLLQPHGLAADAEDRPVDRQPLRPWVLRDGGQHRHGPLPIQHAGALPQRSEELPLFLGQRLVQPRVLDLPVALALPQVDHLVPGPVLAPVDPVLEAAVEPHLPGILLRGGRLPHSRRSGAARAGPALAREAAGQGPEEPAAQAQRHGC
mmetsp:Transcript_124192/g.362460  ORF Transcript_124192/g.362460 Transcript_124192/m.362460 type:complete len:466 (+) Transcript_124192:85-1482(+)